MLAWRVVSESDDDIVFSVRYGFGFCLEFTNMIGETGRYGEFGDRRWRMAYDDLLISIVIASLEVFEKQIGVCEECIPWFGNGTVQNEGIEL